MKRDFTKRELQTKLFAAEKRIIELENSLTRAIENTKIEQKENELGIRSLHSLFESMVMGVVYQDENGAIIFANPAAERILGSSFNEMQGITPVDPRWRAIHEDGSEFPGEKHPAMEALRTGKIVKDMVMGVYHPQKKSYRWILINAVPEFHGEQTRPYQVYTTFVDITDLKQTEDALRQSEEKYRRLAETSDAVIALFDIDGRVQYVNENAAQIQGVSSYELVGKTMHELIPKAEAEISLERLKKVFSSGQGMVVELPYRGHWYRSSYQPIHDKRGSAILVLLSATDITELKNAQNDLLELNRSLEERVKERTAEVLDLYNNAPTGYHSIDKNGIIVRINQTELNWLGYTYEELVGVKPFRELLKLESQQAFDDNFSIFKTQGRLKDLEAEIIRKDGSILPVLVNATAIFDADGKYVQSRATVLDNTARRSAEASLRESEELFRAFFENAADALLLGNLEGQIIAANPATCRMFGWTVRELVNANRDILIDKTDPRLGSLLKERVAKGKAHGELTFQRKDGAKFLGEIISTIYNDKDGNKKASIIIRDITERKQAEIDLRLNEEKYRGLMESLDNIVATVDRNGKFLYMNEIAAKQLGGTTESLIGKTMHELFPEPAASRQLESIQKAMLGDRKVVIESESFINGKIHWYHTAIQPIHDENGQVAYALINATDIRELKAAQQELVEINHTLEERIKQRTAEVQDLYENAPTGYHSLDKNGIYIMINQTELNWLGYDRSEIIGVKRLVDLATPASQKVFIDNYPGFKERGWVKDLEYELIRKDGSILPVLLSATAIYDAKGNYLQSRSTMFDITQRKKFEMALRESRDKLSAANAALEKASRLKDEFLANMSHELRTPLTGILGLSDVLQMKTYGDLNDRQIRTIKAISESGRHLLELINDILDLSKINAGKLKLEIASYSITDICQASLNLTKGMAAQKHQRIQYSLPAEPIMVQADNRRLKQIIVNLLSNAIKFTPENGRLGLEVKSDTVEQKIRISIWDQGIGIKHSDRHKLFSPFTQIDSGLTRENSGTGLGLSLVKRLVELHNGNIEMESTYGEGSRFTVILPWPSQNHFDNEGDQLTSTSRENE